MTKKSMVFVQTFKDPIFIGKPEVRDDTLKIPGFGELTGFHGYWKYLELFFKQRSWPIEVNRFEIVGTKGVGFLLKFVTSLNLEVKFFVPCYSHSSSSELQISSNGKTIKRSISSYVK